MRVKICGITQVDQAVAITRLGASDLGFICVEASPRYIAPAHIRPIVEALQAAGPVNTVGVFANANEPHIQSVMGEAGLCTVQLHGNETPEFCRQIRQALPSTKIIKAFHVRSAADLAATRAYEPYVDTLLLDAYHPHLLGGTGKTLDWAMLQTFRPQRPWLMAGGLNPGNITEALAKLSPDGIDLSSGVESAPGIKDLQKVARLFEQLQPWLAGVSS